MVYEETHLYKNLFKEVINMGVQNDNNFEGSIFERSLNFHNENKNADDRLKPLPESKGEWEKHINGEILPS